MNARKNKRRVMQRMASPRPFDSDSNRMDYIRGLKPCKTYSPWCSNCNAVLFKEVTGRFPYNISEFFAFEDLQQKDAV